MGQPREPGNFLPTNASIRKDHYIMAIISLILGIFSLVGWLLPICGLPMSVTGLIFGIVGRDSSRRGMAIAGLVMSIIATVLGVGNAAVGAYQGSTRVSSNEICYLQHLGSSTSIALEGFKADAYCTKLTDEDPSMFVVGSNSGGSVVCTVEIEGYTFTVRDTNPSAVEGAFMCKWLNTWRP